MARTKFVFIRAADGSIYYLDAVMSIAYNQSGTPTKYALESGGSSSDHYSEDQDSLSINGRVSQVKFLVNQDESTDLELFERSLTALKKSRQFFTVGFSENLDPIPNCLFTSLVMSKDTSTGRYALDISMSVVQVEVAQGVGITDTPRAAVLFEDVVKQQDAANGNTVEPIEEERVSITSVQSELSTTSGAEFLRSDR